MSATGITPIITPLQAIPADATVLEAAHRLVAERSSLPVVEDDGTVLGVVDSGSLLDGLVPGYLREITHTGFIRKDPAGLLRRALECGRRPVREVVQELPEFLEQGASVAHAAELFMHTGVLAIPVIDSEGALVGVVRRVDLVVALATG